MKMWATDHPHNVVDKNSNGLCFEKSLGFDESHKNKWEEKAVIIVFMSGVGVTLRAWYRGRSSWTREERENFWSRIIYFWAVW